MDVKIENRDILLDSCGEPVYINGIEEIAQRVKIVCTLKKGDFVYDRELGRYDIAFDSDEQMLCDKLEMIFKEATIDIPYSNLQVISVQKNDRNIIAKIEITCGIESATTEVTING